MHKSKAVIISCMDFRFQKIIQEFLKQKKYIGHCDQIIIAGATRDFIEPIEKKYGEYVWRQLDLSVKLHDPDEIVFIDHQDCGGYAIDGFIKGGLPRDEDHIKHKNLEKRLAKIVKKKYPSKQLLFFYVDLDGKIDQLIV